MHTTNNEGLSNIYAAEPRVYLSAFPSLEQQQTYALQAAMLGERSLTIAVLFVSTLIFTAMAVS